MQVWKRWMLLVRYGWDRIFHPRSRADELFKLCQRFLLEASVQELSPEERELATAMKGLREKLIQSYGIVYACSSCAKGCILPHGRWDGGFCCSGNTEDIFSPLEIAAIKASGTKVSDLQPPKAPHAGCAFRGPQGCNLQPEHRPNLCISYICNDLSRELARSQRLDTVEGLGAELTEHMLAFKHLRQERLDQEEWERLDALIPSE